MKNISIYIILFAILTPIIALAESPSNCKSHMTLMQPAQQSAGLGLLSSVWSLERNVEPRSLYSLEKYNESRKKFMRILDEQKTLLGECFDTSNFGLKIAEEVTKVKVLDVKHAEGLGIFLERVRIAELKKAEIDKGIGNWKTSYTDADVNATISKITVPGMSFITINVEAINPNKIVRPSTHEIWSSENSIKPIAGSFPVGISMNDNFGNEYLLQQVTPEFIHKKYKTERKNLLAGMVEVFELSFKDGILPTVEYVELNVEDGVFGNLKPFKFKIPRELIL